MSTLDTAHLMEVLSLTAELLHTMGAPARDAPAAAARGAIAAAFSAAAASGDAAALAAATTRALRTLAAQLKVLRLDAANARLRMLSGTLRDGSGIR